MVFVVLSIIVYKDELFKTSENNILKRKPFVSLIVPAFNEEETVANSIRSLKKVSYKNVEFIFLNDGSSDNTAKIISREIALLRKKGENRFRFIDNKVNKGKAATLNQGIKLAKGEFIACMDADTVVEKDIFQKVLVEFSHEKVGAVTVAVEVKNKNKLLNKIISVEFNLGLSLLLRVFSFAGVVWVTPGPFSIYRKSVLDEINGFDPKSIVEDHEIAFRINSAGYTIKNTMHAHVWAFMPETFKGSYVQRRRWYSGSIITLFDHKDKLFKKKEGLFSFFIPFNMFIIFLSLIFFLATVIFSLVKLVKQFIFFSQTGFNFFAHWNFIFDPLYYGRVNILGASMFIMVIVFILVGLILSKRRLRDNPLGIILFPFFYVFYQIYWWGAVISTITTKRGKLKWR
jgi:cellulose synthase/poly-beta-1,6-N-acetylglucosamine synthase-like glycosyltransferase